MTITLGRCLNISDPDDYAVTPTTRGVAISAEVRGDTLAEAQAYRRQLEGTIQAGAVEPFTWTEDPTQNGSYRVVGGSTDVPVFGLIAFTFKVKIQLERMPHFQATRTYADTDGKQRSGAPGGTSEDYWLAVPSSVVGCDLDGDGAVPYTRTGPSGTVRFYVDTILAAVCARWRCAPGDRYDMSPRFMINSREQVGDEIHQPDVAGGDVVTLDNGIILLQSSTSASYTFDVYFPQGASPGSIGAAHHISIGLYLSGTLVVLRPDRWQLTYLDEDIAVIDMVGYVSTPATADDYEVMCSAALRRGSHHFELQLRSNVSAVHAVMTNEAMTEIDAGHTSRVTSDDADHNRMWVASGVGWASPGVFTGGIGRHRTATVLASDWGLGFELNGTSAVAPNTAPEGFDHYWADMDVDLEEGP